jgi:hypothetical protein
MRTLLATLAIGLSTTLFAGGAQAGGWWDFYFPCNGCQRVEPATPYTFKYYYHRAPWGPRWDYSAAYYNPSPYDTVIKRGYRPRDRQK